ncbi:MAG TPA: hypothetical protein PKI14_04465 [Fervidobacterium sp.]|nr:hypothetical protein [Fervidobacterium sp.]
MINSKHILISLASSQIEPKEIVEFLRNQGEDAEIAMGKDGEREVKYILVNAPKHKDGLISMARGQDINSPKIICHDEGHNQLITFAGVSEGDGINKYNEEPMVDHVKHHTVDGPVYINYKFKLKKSEPKRLKKTQKVDKLDKLKEMLENEAVVDVEVPDRTIIYNSVPNHRWER